MSGPLPIQSTPCPCPQDRQESNLTQFLPGALPPLRPNTNPHLNLTPLCPPGLPKAESTCNREAWKFYLSEYPDRCFVDSILNIIDMGTSIGHLGPSIFQICKNLRSATDFPGDISKEIKSLCVQGHIQDPPTPMVQMFASQHSYSQM